MNEWNKILLRQLKKSFGRLEDVPEVVRPFLDVISETYHHFEKDRKMLERSIELSSAEMKQLNQLVRKENEVQNRLLLDKLSESLMLLDQPDQLSSAASEQIKLMHVAEVLKKETLKRKSAEEQRNVHEKQLINANRMFRVLSQINQMIVRIPNEDDLYREACEIVVKFGLFKAACVCIADDGNGPRCIKGSYGILDDLDFVVKATEPLRTKCISDDTYLVSDPLPLEECLTETNRLSLENLGYGSCMILPIKCAGSVIATFNLFSANTNVFNATEVALLKEAAGDMSFALDVLEKDQQRNAAEQKLSLNEWRLRQAQAIAHLGSWSLDFSTGISTWSKEALRIYGIDTAETKQTFESWISHIHPDDLEVVLQASKKCRETRTRTAFFHRIVRGDGEVRDLYSQADIEFNDGGQPIGMYGVAYDVTEMKQSERALRASQSNMQAIFENTSEGFILTGLDCCVKAFNHKAAAILRGNTGLSISEGMDIRTFIHRSREGNYTNAEEEIKAGKVLHYQYQFPQRSPTAKWFAFTVGPVYHAGSVDGFIITASDITERMAYELRLVESEKRYSELFHLSPIPQWVYDQESKKFLDVNKAALAHYGYKKTEFLAMTIEAIRPEEDLPLLAETIEKNKKRRNPAIHQSFRHRKKNGEIIQVEIQSSKMIYNGKKAKIIVARDVTEKHNYIKAIEDQNQKLTEISWMQSHVIRAPLARLMGLMTLIESVHHDPEEIRLIVNYLRISADELDDVIKNITEKTMIGKAS